MSTSKKWQLFGCLVLVVLGLGHRPGTRGAVHLFRAGTVAARPEAMGTLSHHQWCTREWPRPPLARPGH